MVISRELFQDKADDCLNTGVTRALSLKEKFCNDSGARTSFPSSCEHLNIFLSPLLGME